MAGRPAMMTAPTEPMCAESLEEAGKLSRGRYAGIAPGCLLVPVKVLDRDGGGAFADVREGIWWVIENRKRYKIRILNLSVGTVREEKEEGDEAEEALILEACRKLHGTQE